MDGRWIRNAGPFCCHILWLCPVTVTKWNKQIKINFRAETGRERTTPLKWWGNIILWCKDVTRSSSHMTGLVQMPFNISVAPAEVSVSQGRNWNGTFTLSDILKYSSNPCVVMVGHVWDEQINNGRLWDLNSTLFSACQNHLLSSQRVRLSVLSRCFSV